MPPIIPKTSWIFITLTTGLVLLVTLYVFRGITNVPGAINHGSSGLVYSSFEGVRTFGRNRGRVGGGCLIFREAEQTPLDCALSGPPCPNTLTTEAGTKIDVYGYCVPPEADPDTATASVMGSCWFKPVVRSSIRGKVVFFDDSKHCKKGVALPGFHSLASVPEYPLGTSRSVRWRVVTCQNDGANLCKDGKGIFRYGNVLSSPAYP